MRNLRKAAGFALSAALLVALVALVEHYVGFRNLLEPWRLLSPATAAAGVALLLASYAVRALRFYSYFRDRMAPQLALCVKLTCYHNFFNYLLPMRAGEVAFPILMSRYFGIAPAQSIPVLLWFRMLDLHTLVTGALAALPLVGVRPSTTVALVAAWLTLPWFGYRFHVALAHRLERTRGPVGRTLHDALAALPADNRRFLGAWAWTLTNWLAKLLVVTAGLVTFVDTRVLLALAAAVAGETSMVLPVHSVAAVGTYEAGITPVLVAGGVPFDAALAGALNLHLFLVAGVLLTGVIAIAIPARHTQIA